MSKSVTQYDLLISCPSDINDEIKLIDETVNEFNEMYSDTLGISIRTKHWGKSSYAQSGGKPQELLNEQFVKNCDAAVALMWTKFGTPTDEYGSGTEEEIEIMLDSGKQVFMYFSDKPVSPSQQDAGEYEKILAFKEKYKDRGIYFTYLSNEEFKRLFFAHLSKYFLTEKRIAEIKNERMPFLQLKGINNGKLFNSAFVRDFIPNSELSKEKYLEEIKNLYAEISRLKVGKRIENKLSTAFTINEPVNIDEGMQFTICDVAKKLEIGISDDFFKLGNLANNPLAGIVRMSSYEPSLVGTTDEKKKFELIQLLYETILNLVSWTPFESAFSKIKCIKLALTNSGTAVDEDVEIKIIIPKNVLLTHENFPILDETTQSFLLNECEINYIFGIKISAYYNDYATSQKSHVFPVNPDIKLPYDTRNYNSQDFAEALDNIFCYDVYSDEDNYIIKLNIDYIKHNTSVAFPTVIFIKNHIAYLDYEILSKISPKIIKGKIKLEDE